MTRSSSTEPAKPKRKGARSISTFTPSQLARKRATDREAQRAIRARTKEHIQRLERELMELKSKQSGDQTVQELLRRNKALKEELMRLKENLGVPITSSPYLALTPRQLSLPNKLLLTLTVYNDNLSTHSDAITGPRGSPFHYNSLPDYSQQYVPLPNSCESWASTISCPVPSNASSPSSSADNYSASCIPISVPTSILPSNISAMCRKGVVKTEYDNAGYHGTIPQGLPLSGARPSKEVNHPQYPDARFRLSNPPLQPGTPHSQPYMAHHQQQQSVWNVYPIYYPQAQSSIH
ncbi:hypothetical protein NW754_001501 [Fusarium falciforme]|uniref:BZIP domain-containing protein n=1 Tax=Fusarium falciforme TaxID=195108 RepID=A0A9W8UU87_9HYPO|nr:hypothetical protein NW754_001501 [Fusarium falciforme]KAJ4175701.1 hypothetical protein NW755_014798 [Fusarium falciforme]KAJ4175825.1 hypothetical protein NW767_015654 [Fusarium falciforme]